MTSSSKLILFLVRKCAWENCKQLFFSFPLSSSLSLWIRNRHTTSFYGLFKMPLLFVFRPTSNSFTARPRSPLKSEWIFNFCSLAFSFFFASVTLFFFFLYFLKSCESQNPPKPCQEPSQVPHTCARNEHWWMIMRNLFFLFLSHSVSKISKNEKLFKNLFWEAIAKAKFVNLRNRWARRAPSSCVVWYNAPLLLLFFHLTSPNVDTNKKQISQLIITQERKEK